MTLLAISLFTLPSAFAQDAATVPAGLSVTLTAPPVYAPAPVQSDALTEPMVGAAMAVRDCSIKMLASPWTTKRAGRLALDEAQAAAICAEAQGDLALAQARAWSTTVRATGDLVVAQATGTAITAGTAVTYASSSEGIEVNTGAAAEWHAYGTALATGMGHERYGVLQDPRFVPYLLDQGRAAFMSHPAVPGAQEAAHLAHADTASCGTAQECQAQLEAMAMSMAQSE